MNESSAPEVEKKAGSARKEFLSWTIMIVAVVVIALIVRTFLFESFIVDGQSMEPNFHTDERIIVNKMIYHTRDPKPGEVIVLKVPSRHSDFIKRVIAVGGDTVKVTGDTVTVNGKAVDEPYIAAAVAEAADIGSNYNINDFPTTEIPDGKVPEGYLFVMGDNRSYSQDSRMIGYIPMGDVIGRAELVFWPFSEWQRIHPGEPSANH